MTETITNSNVQQLTEQIADWRTREVHVDRQRRLVRNIALTGLSSRNGYRYSEQALRLAAPLYDGKPVFLDHAENLARPHDRSTRDLVGSIVNPRFEGGRLRGDIRALETESGQTFIALAESETPGVGMSHVVLAERNADRSVVEKIHDVVSVDAVVFPATTTTFREQTAHPDDSATDESATVESDESLRAKLECVTAERDRLREQVNQIRRERSEENQRREVEQLLEQSALPESAVTDLFRKQLLETPDSEVRRALIAERITVLKRSAGHLPYSRERLDNDDRRSSDAAVVSAVRGHRRSVLSGRG